MTQRDSIHNTEIFSQSAVYPGFIEFFSTDVFPVTTIQRDGIWSQLNNLFRKFSLWSKEHQQQVVQCGRDFLDEVFPLADGSHHDVSQYHVYYEHFCVITEDGQCMGLKNSGQFAGFNGSRENPSAIFLKDRDLLVEIQIDPTTHAGAADMAGVADIKIDSSQAVPEIDSSQAVPAIDSSQAVPEIDSSQAVTEIDSSQAVQAIEAGTK